MEQQQDPLDIFLPSASELLASTEILLKESGILHSNLVVMADVSQNVAVSDNESVFVKIYRRKDGLEEPRNTRLAQSFGAPTPDLLLSTDWCSVWRFEKLEPLPFSRLPEVLNAVRRVHEETANSDIVEELDYHEALSVVKGRLRKVPRSGVASLVEELASRVCAELAACTEHVEKVFIHADLQMRNMGVSRDRALVFDWEICKMAPVELELSKLEENLFTGGKWHPGLMAELYGKSVDQNLLYLATLLRYSQNLAFFLERGENEVVARQLESYFAYSSLGARE